MGRLRKEVLSLGLSQSENSRIFYKIVDSQILKALSREDWKEVASILERILPGDMAAQLIRWLKAHRSWRNGKMAFRLSTPGQDTAT
jgi:hypothetical protein